VENGLGVDWLLETHAHADHLSAAPYLKGRLGGLIAIGRSIIEVQRVFGTLFNMDADLASDGSAFDRLLDDGDCFDIGDLKAVVLHVPGHTAVDLTYVIGNAAFVGDTIFMPDYGTARADFPGGDPGTLYRSIQRLLSLPEQTVLFLCHDYKAPGRENSPGRRLSRTSVDATFISVTAWTRRPSWRCARHAMRASASRA